MNWRKCGRSNPWCELRVISRHCLEGVRKSRRNLSLGRLFQITNLMQNSCSFSGGQIVSPQPLVSSPSVNNCTVRRWRADCSPLSTCVLYSCLQRVTIPEAVVIQFVLLRMNSMLLETC